MSRTSRIFAAAVFSLALSCADDLCEEAGCWDIVAVVATLPSSPATYEIRFATDLGSTRCLVRVPTESGSTACDNEEVATVRDIVNSTTVEFVLRETRKFSYVLAVGDEASAEQTVEVSGDQFQTNPDTVDYCSGPCEEATITRDLSMLLSNP